VVVVLEIGLGKTSRGLLPWQTGTTIGGDGIGAVKSEKRVWEVIAQMWKEHGKEGRVVFRRSVRQYDALSRRARWGRKRRSGSEKGGKEEKKRA